MKHIYAATPCLRLAIGALCACFFAACTPACNREPSSGPEAAMDTADFLTSDANPEEPDVAPSGADVDLDVGAAAFDDADMAPLSDTTPSEAEVTQDAVFIDVSTVPEGPVTPDLTTTNETASLPADGAAPGEPAVEVVCGPLTAGLPAVGDACDKVGAVRCTGEGASVAGPFPAAPLVVSHRCVLPQMVVCQSDLAGVLRWTAQACPQVGSNCLPKWSQTTCRELPVGVRCCPLYCQSDAGNNYVPGCEGNPATAPVCDAAKGALLVCDPFDPSATWPQVGDKLTFSKCGAQCKDCLMVRAVEICPMQPFDCVPFCEEPPCPTPSEGICGTGTDGSPKCAKTCGEFEAFKKQAGK